ncbi:MAG TPA: hypothetical protein PK784_09060, partial [Tenuifilaceae bacterium]|nr:hypothetical protein [Tenuifilaceae bacterium]HPN21703.1 hypothetical protein [Tenuifilaceae bacterium]
FFLGTIASKNARTSVRLYLSPPASAGGVFYPVNFFSSPVPSVRERKGSNFFLPSNSFAKKIFSFFSAPSTFPERRYSFKAGANIEFIFLIRKGQINIFFTKNQF